MKKIFFLIFIFYSFYCPAFQSGEQAVKKIDGKNYIVYSVKSGDGWYSIARKYNITYSELRLANKDSDDKLFPGRSILIPADKLKANDPFYQKNYTDKKKQPSPKNESIKIHTVSASQTLYSISKMYGITVDELKEWNNLSSNSISTGQKLVVAKSKTEEVSIEGKPADKKSAVDKNINSTTSNKTGNNLNKEIIPPTHDENIDKQAPEKVVENAKPENSVSGKKNVTEDSSVLTVNESKEDKIIFANGRREVNEKGIATCMDEEDLSPDKYYALHRTAPSGTIIRISDISNSRKIYVKVVGKLNDSFENEGVIIKISKASAEKLGESEKSFKVSLLYGVNDE